MMSLASQMYDYYVKPYLGEKGQDLVEYALLLAMIVAIGWVIWNQMSLETNLKTIFENASTVTSKAASHSAGT
jgi:Flp pilus assembly pilin Flp